MHTHGQGLPLPIAHTKPHTLVGFCNMWYNLVRYLKGKSMSKTALKLIVNNSEPPARSRILPAIDEELVDRLDEEAGRRMREARPRHNMWRDLRAAFLMRNE